MPVDYTSDRKKLVALLGQHVKGEKLEHSIAVEKTAQKLAKRYGASRKKAGLAGLLHDITKQQDNRALAKRYGILSLSEKTLHGPVAACWLKEQGIVDEAEVLSAIKYHTTGRADMTTLEKVVYLADFIEPLRDFEGVDKIRAAAERDLDSAMLLSVSMTLNSLITRNMPIDTDSVAAYNYFNWIKNCSNT